MRKIINLPNAISASRLPLGIIALMVLGTYHIYTVIIAALVTDYLDGKVARKLNRSSKLGAIIDPLFDKIFVLIVFFGLIFHYNLPFYWAGFFFARDIFSISSMFVVLKRKYDIDIKARFFGKVVTVMQFLVLIVMTTGNVAWITTFMYSLLGFSAISIIDYGVYFRSHGKSN